MKKRLSLLLLFASACGSPLSPKSDSASVIATESAPVVEGDLPTQLLSLAGVLSVQEISPFMSQGRTFELTFQQAVDHDDASFGTFVQHVTVNVSDVAGPTVVQTVENYVPFTGSRSNEVSDVLTGNTVDVEQRFAVNSSPGANRWDKLTLAQSAADIHEVVTSLRPLFTGTWLSVGYDVDGVVALAHRRFYPSDVNATILRSVPLNFGTNDPRYAAFLETAATAVCRDRIIAAQRAMLERRAEIIPLVQDWLPDETYAKEGSIDVAYEHTVLDVAYKVHSGMHSGVGCYNLPMLDYPAGYFLDTLLGQGLRDTLRSDRVLREHAAYAQLAATQTGSHGVLDQGIADLLHFPGTYSAEHFAPEPKPFDWAAMSDLQAWLASSGERIMRIDYATDARLAAAPQLGAAADSYAYVTPDGDRHYASIWSFETTTRHKIALTWARWANVAPPPLP